MAAAPFGSTRGLVARKKTLNEALNLGFVEGHPNEKLARNTLEQAWLNKSGAALSSFLQPLWGGLGFGGSVDRKSEIGCPSAAATGL